MMGGAVLGALLVGLCLGMVGSGGSLLTVPILRFLAGQPEKVAIAGSLAVGGAISLFAVVPYMRERRVDWPVAALFGIPVMAGSYGGAWTSQFVSGSFQMGTFALTAVTAAVLMFRSPKPAPPDANSRRASWKLALLGFLVGAFTGFVGVGGGFMIVPALVLLGGLEMSKAVPTSLLLIALKAPAGFWKYVDILPAQGHTLDWKLLGLFAAVGVVGSYAGHALHRRLPQAALRKVFAVLVLIVGAGTLWLNHLG